ncbi:hypothetical protein ACJMK2_019282 [Sinanodonta woodiana]|uniref:NmrA-like family domain-containing protein 1 n=1 Tax=Sinanodonta woodiana TaxID=1069815 RepID=A0ABD3UFY0_SINWO
MAAKKRIVVFGATGQQGGSVARALVRCLSFHVCAVTRSPEGKGARELKKIGIEVVKGDFDDIDSLRKVLDEAYGCFLVTDYFEHCDLNREIQQGKNVVEACKTAGVKHLVFSGLENTAGSGVHGPVPHFDGKGKIEDIIQSIGVPCTYIRVSFYYENIINFFPPEERENGKFSVSIPMGDKHLYMISVQDLGPCVVEIFRDPMKYVGKKIGLAGDKLTIEQLCSTLSENMASKQFQNTEITVEQYAKLSFPDAQFLANMFQFYQLREDDLRDVKLTRQLNPKTLSFNA